jgi:two-component system catabolic regulation response regulator CreB
MSSAPGHSPRVLIVEDETAIADTLVYVLRADGFGADHVLLGGDALSAHRSASYDLIVLDVGLPDMTGLEVLRRLRSEGAQVPVVFLTARSEEIDRVLGLELGADDYVTKPFSPREVAARVRAILRREQRRQLAPAVGAWRREPEAMRIDFYGVALDLTRYEYRLLDLLLAHPGRVFTREQIMSRVWVDALDTTDRTIDAHIKTLRSKLKAIRADEDPIRTHRGVGYSLAL